MNIHYFCKPDLSDNDPWQDCLFNADTNLDDLTVEPLITINGQPILRQHQSTYLTGKETCRAHHFAKLLASAVLSNQCSTFPSAHVNDTVNVNGPTKTTPRSVLWIDTVNGPHTSAQIYRELAAHATSKDSLNYICLDILGVERDNVYALTRNIEHTINQLNPALVVIDDIDHFMPCCGVNIASEFCRIVRDVTNHSETSFLFIGYNNLSKKASTTGNLGKLLFLSTTNVFSLSTQREVTTARLVRSYDLSNASLNTQVQFTIGHDNLPHEADPQPATQAPFSDDTLRTVITSVLQPGETIHPDDLLKKVTAHLRQARHHHQAQLLVDQALKLNLLHYTGDPLNNTLTLPPLLNPAHHDDVTPLASPGPLCRDSVAAP